MLTLACVLRERPLLLNGGYECKSQADVLQPVGCGIGRIGTDCSAAVRTSKTDSYIRPDMNLHAKKALDMSQAAFPKLDMDNVRIGISHKFGNLG